MSDQHTLTVVELVKQVKEAIRLAEERVPDKKLAVTKVDLEIKTTFKKQAGAEGKINWLPVPLELSAHYRQSDVQTISMTLIPEQGPVLMGKAESFAEELADAVQVVKACVEEAAATDPPFGLKESTVTLNVVTSKDGKVQIIAGGDMSSENAHTVKLSLSSAE